MNDFVQGMNWGKIEATLGEDGFDFDAARTEALAAVVTYLSGYDSAHQVNAGELRQIIIEAWFSALGDD